MQVLLYLGSHAGDTDVKLVTEVAELLNREEVEVLVFGNKTLREYVAKKFRFRQVIDVSDEELAEIYSSSVVTIAPQKWETFGYVPVESMACGTPVLAFNMMGPIETVIHGRTGWLAENRREFLQYLSSIIKGDLEIEPEYVRRHVEKHFSPAATSAKLEDIIRRYV
jgi:glycosyltransferase involved in cell wall biosynthesis